MRTYKRRNGKPTWLAWWIGWAFLLFWPLALGSAAGEAAWLALVAIVAWFALTGRRSSRRRQPDGEVPPVPGH